MPLKDLCTHHLAYLFYQHVNKDKCLTDSSVKCSFGSICIKNIFVDFITELFCLFSFVKKCLAVLDEFRKKKCEDFRCTIFLFSFSLFKNQEFRNFDNWRRMNFVSKMK